jgi:hypothetical protein
MIELHNIVILERPAGRLEDSAPAAGLRYVERGADAVERIAQCDREHGRKGDHARIARRFAHGFRYFAIEEGAQTVGWFWVLVGGARYFDELRWRLPLRDDQAWGRDAFVVPSHRGRRLLPMLVRAAAAMEGRPLHMLSDVDAVNLPSLRVHAGLGFRRVCTVRAVAIAGRLLWRSAPPPGLPAPTAIRPSRSLLWLSEQERGWHRDHVA